MIGDRSGQDTWGGVENVVEETGLLDTVESAEFWKLSLAAIHDFDFICC